MSGAGSSVGGAAPSRSRSTFRALKSRLPPLQGVATLTSPKLDLLSWLRLQFVADADLDTGRCGLRWRVSTKWSASPGRIGRKERVKIFFVLPFDLFFIDSPPPPPPVLFAHSLYLFLLKRSTNHS